jgi:asparagine synthase (glutamine-hydrolysing)
MAPPAHTDPQKWNAMRALADEYLNPTSIADAGLLSNQGVDALFALHEDDTLSAATQNKLDAVINHLLGVQVLHRHFVAADVPAQARAKAQELDWHPY